MLRRYRIFTELSDCFCYPVLLAKDNRKPVRLSCLDPALLTAQQRLEVTDETVRC